MVNRSCVRAALVVLLGSGATVAGAASWIGTWGSAPLPPSPGFGPTSATPSFAGVTVRESVRLSAGGRRLRIRFTNEYGTKPLHIGAASVALIDKSGAVRSGTYRGVLFGGRASAVIPAASPFVSDPIDLEVPPLATLSISLYFPDDTGPCTCHAVAMEKVDLSDSGDFTEKEFTPKRTIQSFAFISGVDVQSTRPAKTIVALGDSITDGVGSTPGANRRWPDLLADRLDAPGHARQWGIVNMGISGNQVLNDGAGQSALARLDRDVLSVPGAAYVIVFEGVNDLGISYGHFTGPLAARFKSLMPANKATAAGMIEGYRQIIARAHLKGLKVIGATITPYEGAGYYSAEGNAVRKEINAWIRTGGAFDGVLDFDAALLDKAHPDAIAAGLHAGDHLHGSDAGYQAIARSIDLSIFK